MATGRGRNSEVEFEARSGRAPVNYQTSKNMRDLKDKAHELLSRGVLLPLVRWQRAARPSRHAPLRAYREGMRLRERALGWGVEERREWVLRRLRFAVRRAARDTDYYGELFREAGFDPETDFGFDEFARLPVLEREDVRRAGHTLVSRTLAESDLKKDATGGSTGEPTEIWLGPEERGWAESGIEFSMRRAGVPPGTSTGFLWGHHLDPVARETRLERFHDFAQNVRWFDCFRLSPEVLEQYHRAFERWRPACVVAYANALSSLAEHVLERGGGRRPGYPRKCFVTGAEKLLPAQRERIEEAFGRPIHERYGSRDAGLMAFQYEPRRTLDYEVDWANIFVEPETAGEDSAILITKLHADGMPLIRYRVGDVGRFHEGSQPGTPSFVLREVIGRVTDRIWLPDGRWVHGIQLPHMMKDYPVREFMFTQHADYSIGLKIVPRNGFGEESRRRILATLADNLPDLPVTIELVKDIPRTKANKWRPVVSEVETQPNGDKEEGSLEI